MTIVLAQRLNLSQPSGLRFGDKREQVALGEGRRQELPRDVLRELGLSPYELGYFVFLRKI